MRISKIEIIGGDTFRIGGTHDVYESVVLSRFQSTSLVELQRPNDRGKRYIEIPNERMVVEYIADE